MVARKFVSKSFSLVKPHFLSLPVIVIQQYQLTISMLFFRLILSYKVTVTKKRGVTISLNTILTFPIFLPKLRNEKTEWSGRKNFKQKLSIFLYRKIKF